MKAAIDAFVEDYKEEGEAIPGDDVTITTRQSLFMISFGPDFRSNTADSFQK
jgi:hypothetical protein